jgi:hypothetical protein
MNVIELGTWSTYQLRPSPTGLRAEGEEVRSVYVRMLLGVVRCVGPRRALALGQGEVSRL